MHIRAAAFICAVRPHGEHGAVVRVLTRDHGLLGGYVQGAHARDKRPILIPANEVAVELRARTETQLPSLTVELTHSYGPLMQEPLAAAALTWLTTMTTHALPEGYPYPRLYDMLGGVLGAVEAAPAARDWAASVVRFELSLLTELGFGFDLSQCVVTGARDDLQWISPKSGGAVSRTAGADYAAKLLAFPKFLRDGTTAPDWDDILAGFALTGHFLERHLFCDDPHRGLAGAVFSVRGRLVDRLQRAAC
jgi:DNA repair protein RecO (recombination protein O)